MKVELTPDVAQWVAAALEAGRFATAEDAVRYAINYAKWAELREMLDASESAGGAFSADEARQHVRGHLTRLAQPPKVS